MLSWSNYYSWPLKFQKRCQKIPFTTFFLKSLKILMKALKRPSSIYNSFIQNKVKCKSFFLIVTITKVLFNGKVFYRLLVSLMIVFLVRLNIALFWYPWIVFNIFIFIPFLPFSLKMLDSKSSKHSLERIF